MRGDIEDVKAAFAALLRGPDYARALATIEDEKRDGLTPPAPSPDCIAENETAVLGTNPNCDLVAITGVYDEDDEVTCRHDLAIVWTVAGDTEDQVTRAVQRYIRATREVLKHSTLTLAESAGPVRVIREDWSDLSPNPNAAGSPLLKSGRLLVRVPTFTV
jgi:hypothetical protein